MWIINQNISFEYIVVLPPTVIQNELFESAVVDPGSEVMGEGYFVEIYTAVV